MTKYRTCGKCAAPITAQDPENLCPRCLIESALEIGAPPEASSEIARGNRLNFGNYELLSEIGRGGQGVVYRARQNALNREVAVKCIPIGQFTSPNRLKRFRIEAEAAARLDHAGIVPVYEVGERDGFCFYSMKLMEGGRLDQMLGRRPMPPRQAAELLISIGRAVHFAHQRGILHRDLKPANILLDRTGQPHLTDFGLARLMEQDSTLTHTIGLLGTPSYMAPEQVLGGTTALDPAIDSELSPPNDEGPVPLASGASQPAARVGITTAADVYGLGAILYHLLTGIPPFAGGTSFETVRLVLEAEPRSPRDFNPAVDPDLETICLKCLEKDPRRRYGSAEALVEELERWKRGEPILARPVSRTERVWRWCRKKPALAMLSGTVGLLLIVLGVGAPVAAFRIDRERQFAEAQAYTSAMQVVAQAWEEGNLRRAQDLLLRYLPQPGRRDLRGFEWRYLWNHCQDESQRSTKFSAPVRMAQAKDGRWLAAVSGSTLKLLDENAARELRTLSAPTLNQAFTAVCFSPASPSVLATASERTLMRWDVLKGEVTASLTLSNAAASLAFSPDGKHLAAVGGDILSVEVWDLVNGTQLWQRLGDPWISGNISAVAFTPDGQSLVTSGGVGGNPLLWTIATRQCTALPLAHKGWVGACAFSTDGRTLATGASDGKVVLWDWTTRQVRDRITVPGGDIDAIALSPDGHYLLTGAGDATVRLWTLTPGGRNRVFRGHEAGVNGVFFGPDGQSVISSSSDETVKVWDLDTKPLNRVLHTNETWSSVATISPDGKKLVTTDSARGVLSIWDVATLSFITDLKTPAGTAVSFSPNGRWLARTGGDCRIELWDASSLAHSAILTNSFDPSTLSFSMESRILAVAGLDGTRPSTNENRLAFWDVVQQRKMDLLRDAVPNAACVVFARQHSLVAVGYMDGAVRIWNYQTQQLHSQFTNDHVRIWSMAFSPDDSWLAAGGSQGALSFYRVHERQLFRPSSHTSRWVLGLAFSPDGRTLASAELDGAIRLWDLFTRQCVLELRGHEGAVSKVAFSPDGRLLVSCGGADGTLRLWPAPTLAEIDGQMPVLRH